VTRSRRYVVYAGLFALTMINYVDRINLSVAAGPIAAQFHLSPVEMGYIFSSFLWTYILCLTRWVWRSTGGARGASPPAASLSGRRRAR
jgi:sugar phosphate permease